MRKYLIGYLGFESNKLDGQTVKTRNILHLLLKYEKNSKVDYFDNERLGLNPISVFTMFRKLLKSDVILYLPAQRNLKYLFPFLYVLSKLTHKKIHYYVVGGWLSEFLENKPFHCAMLKKIDSIFTETSYLKHVLISQFNFKNVHVFPNFRLSNPREKLYDGLVSNQLRLVFMSRIIKDKGLEVIHSLCEYILNAQIGNISISFYGPIGESDREFFEGVLCAYSFVEYKGVLQPEDISSALSDYDVLILPTRFYTEGLPGAVVDAYQAGLPVIVTKWKYATEFVDDGKTGFIIPFENPNQFFINAVLRFRDNTSLIVEMRKYIFDAAYKYSLDNALTYFSTIYK